MKGKDVKEILDFLEKENRLKVFKKYLHADYFNQSNDLKYLYDFLMKWQTKQSKKEAQWEELAIDFIQKQRGSKGKSTAFGKYNLENLLSRLLNLMVDFVAIENFRTNSINKSIMTAKYAMKNNLPRLFNKQFKKTKTALEKYPVYSEERSLLEHELEQITYQSFHRKKRTDKNNLQILSNQIDTNFILTRLKCSCNLLSHQLVAKEVYQDCWIEPVVQYLEEDSRYKRTEELIKVYYYCYKLLNPKNIAKDYTWLNRLKTCLHENKALIDNSELKNIYMIIINFLINQLNYQSDTATYPYYRNQVIEWVDNILHIYQLSDYVDFHHTLYNAVAVILKVKMKTEKEYQKVSEFINDKTTYIPQRNQNTFKCYNLGFMHFKRGLFLINQQIEFYTKGKTGQLLSSSMTYAIQSGYRQAESAYRKAMRELVKYNSFHDTPRRLLARTALLRIYYDLPEKGDFEKEVVEMSDYLKSREVKQLSTGKYLIFESFYSIIFQLHQFRKDVNTLQKQRQEEIIQETYKQLKKKITEDPALVSYKEWLSYRLCAIWEAPEVIR